MSLLDNAKSLKSKTHERISPELVELAVAWAKDEITITQVQSALNTKGSNVYAKLALALRVYIKNINQ